MRRLSASWVLYDIASSGYVLLITAVAFPLYFKTYVTGNAPWSDLLWGALLAAASTMAGIIAPAAGAAADISGKRLCCLAIATGGCSLATISLAATTSLPLIALLFVLSYVAYLVAAGLYDALLKSIATPERSGLLSGLGWGLGYIGGLICYVLSHSFFGSNEGASTASTYSLTFVVVGLYYGLIGGVAIYGMRHVRQPALDPGSGSLLARSFARVSATMSAWKAGGEVPRLIIGVSLVTGAAGAIAVFTPLILAGYFGLAIHEVAFLSAMFSLIAIPSTLLAGVLTLRINSLMLLLFLIPVWLVVILTLVLGTGWWAGLAVALCLGAVIGPTNAVARAIVANSIREEQAGEMFGFAALVNRLAAALGPLFFGALSSASASRWLPLLVVGSALLAGLLTMPKRLRSDLG
ncbi:MFS transporter [Aestuariivirga sp.]|uniref:MFS transporter n=1 Tax=Aestuariivirga sp. TaxID=2650926 RepID=UPI003593D8AE